LRRPSRAVKARPDVMARRRSGSGALGSSLRALPFSSLLELNRNEIKRFVRVEHSAAFRAPRLSLVSVDDDLVKVNAGEPSCWASTLNGLDVGSFGHRNQVAHTRCRRAQFAPGPLFVAAVLGCNTVVNLRRRTHGVPTLKPVSSAFES